MDGELLKMIWASSAGSGEVEKPRTCFSTSPTLTENAQALKILPVGDTVRQCANTSRTDVRYNTNTIYAVLDDLGLRPSRGERGGAHFTPSTNHRGAFSAWGVEVAVPRRKCIHLYVVHYARTQITTGTYFDERNFNSARCICRLAAAAMTTVRSCSIISNSASDRPRRETTQCHGNQLQPVAFQRVSCQFARTFHDPKPRRRPHDPIQQTHLNRDSLRHTTSYGSKCHGGLAGSAWLPCGNTTMASCRNVSECARAPECQVECVVQGSAGI
jgi:hypothetical protein